MADKKGFGMKTSSINNYYKLLADAKPNVQDLQRKGGEYSDHWKGSKKGK